MQSKRLLDIKSMVRKASDKLDPIIEYLLKNSNNYDQYLTTEKYEDALLASGLIKKIINALEYSNIKTNIKSLDFELERYQVDVGQDNKIFIDTILLIQLIDLYNVLEDIKVMVDKLSKSNASHSVVQTDSMLSIEEHEPNKIFLKLKQPLKKSSLMNILDQDFTIFPSLTDIEDKDEMDSPNSQQIFELNDAAHANKVIIKCIYNLQEVSRYLGIEKKDASTICSRVEIDYDDDVPYKDEDEKSRGKGKDLINGASKCSCIDCIGSGLDVKECDDDKIIICIKGRNNDEGDVKIVIRQCPDQKNGSKSEAHQKLGDIDDKPDTEHSLRDSKPIEYDRKSNESKQSEKNYQIKDEPEYIEAETSDENLNTEDEYYKEHALLNDNNDCSQINLFQTTKLCFKTDTGQEFMISLKVTPKVPDTKISLTDLFSDDERMHNNHTKSASSATYFMEDHIIPLQRTKICSSLDFDVTEIESKIKEKGIRNKNPKIVVKLNDLGVDNLLRASRPAKCCRKSVLNEKMKKHLPYPASLRSLPLDDADMDVINQSVQMSLQRMKNSTNLKKDRLFKQMPQVNRVHVVMYFHVETPLAKNLPKKPPEVRSRIKKKLSYYIDLVKDEKSDKNIKNQVVKKKSYEASKSRKLTQSTGSGEVLTSPATWIKNKWNKYDEKPITSGIVIPDKHESKCNKKVMKSKIPRPQKKMLCTSVDVETPEEEVYNISRSSLSTNNYMQLKEPSLENQQNNDTHLKHQQLLPSMTRSLAASKCYTPSKRITRKLKKKKKEYYFSRSKSETSLSTLRSTPRHKKSNIISKMLLSEKLNKKLFGRSDKLLKEELFKKDDLTVLLLNHFSEFLYSIVVDKMANDTRLEHLFKNEKGVGCCNVQVSTTNDSSIGLSNPTCKTTILFANFKAAPTPFTQSFHELKARKSQSHLLLPPQILKNHFILNNLAIQTSQILCINEHCQTSQTLITYKLQLQPDVSFQNNIFSNFYNEQALTGSLNSCDKIDKFIVVFQSSGSSQSNVSEHILQSPVSIQSFDSVQNNAEESLSCSLLKLKETLEMYEDVKKKINCGSMQQKDINPIEYFVYQMCACNKFQKKPSMIERILSKTKGRFSSGDRDVGIHMKIKKIFSANKQDKNTCRNCGCNILNCEKNSSFVQDTNEPVPCCKKKKISKKAEKLSNSLSKLRSFVQTSFSSMLKRQDHLDSCSCSKSMHCSRKENAATDTVRDASIQNCQCTKCQNFSDDGSCCCSHCLGCLDKSFETKPEHNDVGTLCNCPKEESKEDNPDLDDTSDAVMQTITKNEAVVEEIDIDNNINFRPATFYLLTTPNLFQELRLSSVNPFWQCNLSADSSGR